MRSYVGQSVCPSGPMMEWFVIYWWLVFDLAKALGFRQLTSGSRGNPQVPTIVKVLGEADCERGQGFEIGSTVRWGSDGDWTMFLLLKYGEDQTPGAKNCVITIANTRQRWLRHDSDIVAHLSSMSNLNVPNHNSVRYTSKLDNPVEGLWTSDKTLHIEMWWIQISNMNLLVLVELILKFCSWMVSMPPWLASSLSYSQPVYVLSYLTSQLWAVPNNNSDVALARSRSLCS